MRSREPVPYHNCASWTHTQSTPKIFFLCDWLQMSRVDAAPNPAQVVQVQPFGNWPHEKFIRNSVSQYHNIKPFSGSFAASELPVSMAADHPGPNPTAGIRFRGNKLQKAFDIINVSHSISFGSIWSGLREVGNFVAARSYFTTLEAV
jgi:hypothetical protein